VAVQICGQETVSATEFTTSYSYVAASSDSSPMDTVDLSQYFSSSDNDCPITSYGAVYNADVSPTDEDQIYLSDIDGNGLSLTTTIFFNEDDPNEIGVYPGVVGTYTPQVYGMTLGDQYDYVEFTIETTCGINS